jgi:hypothetical protein
LRLLRPGYSTGSLLLACTAVFALVGFGRLPGHTLFWQELQNTLHTLVFFILAFLILHQLRHHTRPAHAPLTIYLIAAGISLLIGMATEITQWVSGRGFGLIDVLRDLAGIAMASLLYALRERTAAGSRLAGRQALRGLLATLLAGLLIVSCYPLGTLTWHYVARNQAFPIIMDLRANWAGRFIKLVDAVQAPGTCGPDMTGLDLLPAPYPGISVVEPVPDWRAYRQLVIALHSMSPAPFDLAIRIHDRLHDQAFTDRFNRTLPVNPGPNRYRIPLIEIRDGPTRRSLALDAVAGVMLFASNPPQSRRICMGRMWLEK